MGCSRLTGTDFIDAADGPGTEASTHEADKAQQGARPNSYVRESFTKLNNAHNFSDLRLLSRFKANLSGIPNPDNPFMKHWVPYLIQDPLLINIVLFTSACFLNETGHLPKSVVAALRGIVYQSLNENLRSSRAQTTDAAILAVAEMVLDEWYWGGTQDLHAHMSGLRTMISMRGGLQDLGMHGLISKMVLS